MAASGSGGMTGVPLPRQRAALMTPLSVGEGVPLLQGQGTALVRDGPGEPSPEVHCVCKEVGPQGVPVVMQENLKIPAGKSRIFFVDSKVTGLALFEPGIEMPEGLQGIPTLSGGGRITVQLDNHSGKDVTLNSQWTIGRVYSVQLVAKAPPVSGKELPDIPESLSERQQKQLQELLFRYKDVFAKKHPPPRA